MSEWISLMTSWHVFTAQTQHFLNYKKEFPLSGVTWVWKSSEDGILLLILYEVEITISLFFPSLSLSKYASELHSQFIGSPIMTWMLFHECSLLLKKSLSLSQLWEYKFSVKMPPHDRDSACKTKWLFHLPT